MRFGGCGDGAITRRWGELADESGLQALGLAIVGALEEGSLAAEALPERSRARAGNERARGLRGFEVVALDPVGEPG